MQSAGLEWQGGSGDTDRVCRSQGAVYECTGRRGVGLHMVVFAHVRAAHVAAAWRHPAECVLDAVRWHIACVAFAAPRKSFSAMLKRAHCVASGVLVFHNLTSCSGLTVDLCHAQRTPRSSPSAATTSTCPASTRGWSGRTRAPCARAPCRRPACEGWHVTAVRRGPAGEPPFGNGPRVLRCRRPVARRRKAQGASYGIEVRGVRHKDGVLGSLAGAGANVRRGAVWRAVRGSCEALGAVRCQAWCRSMAVCTGGQVSWLRGLLWRDVWSCSGLAEGWAGKWCRVRKAASWLRVSKARMAG